MLSSLVLSLALAFSAQASAPAAKQAAQAAKDTSSEIVCKKTEDTGSRLGGHKVCHTRAEWDQINRDTSQVVQQQQMQAYSGNPH